MDSKQTQYRIELYLGSYNSDPVAAFCSSTPFMPMQVGDEIAPYAWSDGNGESYANREMVPKDSMLEVIGIRHLMMIHRDSITQSTSVKVSVKHNAD
jgi:hypothetical protein